MNRIDSDLLRVYVVWLPVLRGDSLQAARKATVNLDDSRVMHFWATDLNLAKGFRKLLGLEKKLAWDVFLLYAGDAQWNEDGPPSPEYFMHNWDKVILPRSSRFDGVVLADKVKRLFDPSAGGEQERND